MKDIYSAKKISIICYGISALIFLAIYTFGVFLSPGDEIGYVLLNFYIVMPITTLIVSIIISNKKGYLFWFYPVFVGLLGIIIPSVVFNTFEMLSLLFAFIPALIGLIIGTNIRTKKRYEIN